jgi:parallel beta-helix repeat protein
MASGQVRIEGDGVQGEAGPLTDGIVVLGPNDNSKIDGVEIKGFAVNGFAGSGIATAYVTNFNIENNVTSNMKDMGIWPTLSANGQVKKNIAYGTIDSALWVEASENVRVINNELYDSPTGLEVTISKDITMENNNIHDNTVGIGLYHPAGAGLDPAIWPTYEYGNWSVANNDVHHNNNENPANGGLTGELPPGIGVLISGASNIEVKQNRIEMNNIFGVAMIDWCVGLGDPSCQYIWSSDFPDQYKDPTVNDTRVIDNKFAGNGISPLPFGEGYLPGSDIIYVGADYFSEYLPAGTDNCQGGNKLIKTRTPKSPGPTITALPDGALGGC